MNDVTSWIAGLMRQNTDAVGFIPYAGLERDYVNKGRYIIQRDERGHGVGYLLHGKPTFGGILVVTQHVIELDRQLHGYGAQTFDTLIERAKQANCRAIRVRCAADLPSNEFWRAMGLEVTNVKRVANRRQRDINVMMLDLWPTLWKHPK